MCSTQRPRGGGPSMGWVHLLGLSPPSRPGSRRHLPSARLPHSHKMLPHLPAHGSVHVQEKGRERGRASQPRPRHCPGKSRCFLPLLQLVLLGPPRLQAAQGDGKRSPGRKDGENSGIRERGHTWDAFKGHGRNWQPHLALWKGDGVWTQRAFFIL